MGQLGVLGVCEVSVTNVKRKRVKAQNDQLPSRSGFLCCQKIALSFAAGEWLAIRCDAWLALNSSPAYVYTEITDWTNILVFNKSARSVVQSASAKVIASLFVEFIADSGRYPNCSMMFIFNR